MRGALGGHEHYPRLYGIIPAYAGSTRSTGSEWLWYEDHPRVCGEHRVVVALIFWVRGSSPRMRGAQFSRLVARWRRWIIPAYAGSTH